MASRGSIDAALVEAARAGDDEAREAVLSQLEGIFRAFFHKRLGRSSDVDDLVQNALLRVHESLERLRRPESLKAFAMKAAVFELQDLYRGRYGPKEAVLPPEYVPDKAGVDGQAAARLDVERLLGGLTPKARRIMELRAYGYRYREIAKMVDTTEAAVKMQVKRAFEKMRGMIGSP